MEDKKIINSIADMELQMLGIAYKLKQNENISEATSAIEVLARKCKGAAMTMTIRNDAALQELDRLRNDNKILKGKLDHAVKDKAKALGESGSLQFKVVRLEGEILKLKESEKKLQQEMEMKVSQDIIWGDTDEDEEELATSGKDQPNTIIKDCNENEITEEPSFKKQKK